MKRPLERSSLQIERDNLKSEVASLKNALAVKDTEINNKNVEISSKNTEVNSWKSSYNSLQSQVNSNSNNSAVKDNEISNLKSSYNNLQNQSKLQVSNLENALASVKVERDKLLNDFKGFNQKLDLKDGQINKLSEKLLIANNSLKEMQTEYELLKVEIPKKLALKEAEIEELILDKKEFVAQNNILLEDVAELKADKKDLRADKSRLQKEVAELKGHVEMINLTDLLGHSVHTVKSGYFDPQEVIFESLVESFSLLGKDAKEDII